MSLYSGKDGNKVNLSCCSDQLIGVFVHLPFVFTFANEGRTMTLAYSCHYGIISIIQVIPHLQGDVMPFASIF
jgi:hypothetical protein